MVEMMAADMAIKPTAPNIIPSKNESRIEKDKLINLYFLAERRQAGIFAASINSTADEASARTMTKLNILSFLYVPKVLEGVSPIGFEEQCLI